MTALIHHLAPGAVGATAGPACRAWMTMGDARPGGEQRKQKRMSLWTARRSGTMVLSISTGQPMTWSPTDPVLGALKSNNGVGGVEQS